MAPWFPAAALLLIGACLFVPTFVVALVMLRSTVRAFVLSATFTMGALAGALLALAGVSLIARGHSPDVIGVLQAVFVAAGSVGGAVLAVFLLGRLSKFPPWRRY
jgi:hypothetical protein